MANTSYIKKVVESFVRERLSEEFGIPFIEASIPLLGGGEHLFDAVGVEGDHAVIVGNVLSNRPFTRGGRENAGAVQKAHSDLDYLNRVPEGTRRLMIFTDPDFCELIQKRSGRWNSENIEMLVCPLPPDIKVNLKQVLDDASREQRSRGE